MITFLYGTYGSGKTTAILDAIKKDTDLGIHTFLIVPEQETVQSEHATLRFLAPSAQLHLEVLNFSRLYNRVCREYGGLSYRYITKPIRHLLMWQNLRELAPMLKEYGVSAESDPALGEVMLSALNECKASGISPADLEAYAAKLSPDHPLATRLSELALIFASFDRLVAENYSDSAEDLSRLYGLLKKENFFSGCHVYIDSFTSFTAVEHWIIERIFAQAENVTISIPLSHPMANDISTASVRASLQKLVRSAELHGGHREAILHGNRRAASPAIAYLAEHLWQMDVSDKEQAAFSDGSIHLEICDTPYSEADATAAQILELLRSGERCKDILILARDPEKYRGILEPALEKSNIPFFFSEKNDFCAFSPIKLLLSALRIKQYRWQKNDILSHVKTGLYDFSDRSVDLFEEYLNTWNLHGARFTDEDWTMNPDGFSERLSPRGVEILEAANEIRQRLTEILERFFILLDAARTVPDLCRAVYRYLTEIDLETRLHLISVKEAERGRIKEAKVIQSLYGIILNTLADIAVALPEQEANTEEFYDILKTVFSQTEVGAIPTSVDEVTVGSAATLRASQPKYVFILGLCEGEFPASVADHGLFSTADRATLSSLGMELSSDADTRSSDELMYVRRAFAAPSHGLYLFTSAAQLNGKAYHPSLPFERVRTLFQNVEPHRYSPADFHYLVSAPRVAASQLRLLVGTPDGQALKEALAPHLANVSSLSELPTEASQCEISEPLVREMLGNELRFSATRFETYVECPMNYYCTYVLGLREKKQATFRSSVMGSFIHYILEHLLRFATEKNDAGELPDDESLIRKTEEAVEEYIARISPPHLKNSRRLKHLYTRLKRLALLMIRNIVEEFSHSEFEPAFFELSTNGRNGNPAPMEFVWDDGFRVSFAGIIDRVDLLKKDGEIYIRVVDYKTGTKVFSLDDVSEGINLQMLLYLFALCRNQNTEFSKSIGLSPDQVPTPAGVVYLSANVPVLQAEGYDSEESVLQKASDSLKRSGLLLNEESILLAMNDELSPKFLAGIKRNKDGIPSGSALADREEFNALYTQIEATVRTIADELRGGRANAEPMKIGGKTPCSYCNMKPICRRADK